LTSHGLFFSFDFNLSVIIYSNRTRRFGQIKKREQHPNPFKQIGACIQQADVIPASGDFPLKTKKPAERYAIGTAILLTEMQSEQNVQCRNLLYPNGQRTKSIYRRILPQYIVFVNSAKSAFSVYSIVMLHSLPPYLNLSCFISGKFSITCDVYKQKVTPLLRTLKTELPPPEVIQDLRTVCHDTMPSAPTEELPHSGNLPIRGPKERRKWSGRGALKSYFYGG